MPVRSYDRRGLAITAIGGMLFTLDVPLLRLAAGDLWTMIFARGICLAFAISLWWYLYRWASGAQAPFINGWPGVAVAITNTLANIMFIAAVTKTTAANLVFILSLNPVFCTILSWLFLREVVPRAVWLCVLMAMLGVAVIGWDGLSTGTYIGDFLAVGVALCTAIGLTVVRRSGRNVVPSLAVGSMVSAFIAYWFMSADTSTLTQGAWGWIALNGLLVVPLASGLIAIGPKYIPAAEVAMFFLLDTVFTPFWIWMIFGELPTQRAFAGGLVILLSLLLLAAWRFRTSRTTGTEAALPPHPV
jgi:drug/metabolite transporter (DMT)-like permease